MRIVIAAAALLASCTPTPPWYSVPVQHKPLSVEGTIGYGEFVRANDPEAETYFIKDVRGLEGAAWRWTLAEPEFRFFLKSAKGRVFHLNLGINDVTFRTTGPVRMQIFVNGQLLDEPVFQRPGDAVLEKAVPDGWLKPQAENRVLVKVLNAWPAADPGIFLGFVLHDAGFVSQ